MEADYYYYYYCLFSAKHNSLLFQETLHHVDHPFLIDCEDSFCFFSLTAAFLFYFPTVQTAPHLIMSIIGKTVLVWVRSRGSAGEVPDPNDQYQGPIRAYFNRSISPKIKPIKC